MVNPDDKLLSSIQTQWTVQLQGTASTQYFRLSLRSSRKGKTQSWKTSVFPKVKRRRQNRQNTDGLGELMFWMILSQWVHVFLRLSRLMDCTTPRVGPKVNYGVRVMVCQCKLMVLTGHTLWCSVWYWWGRVLSRNQGVWDQMGMLWTFCSIFL